MRQGHVFVHVYSAGLLVRKMVTDFITLFHDIILLFVKMFHTKVDTWESHWLTYGGIPGQKFDFVTLDPVEEVLR